MIKQLRQILTSVAYLTKAQERCNSEITELRQKVNKLSLEVNQLKSDLENSQTSTQLVLDNYKSEINYVKEGIAAKFDVLTTRLDMKIADFESRMQANKRASKARKSLKKP